MAKKSIVPLVLRDSFTSATTEQSEGEYKALDVSAYVDPLNGKVLKIENVTVMIDTGSGLPMTDSDITSEYCVTTQLLAGSQTGLKSAGDDRCISSTEWVFFERTHETGSGAFTSQGTDFSTQVLAPPARGYYLAADTMTIIQKSVTDAASSLRFMWIIEAQRVKLSAQDVNFLLVNQTQTQ